jgi:hypothetical protein
LPEVASVPLATKAQETDQRGTSCEEEIFGDQLIKKPEHTLRIGFMNISGMQANNNDNKDNNLRQGISALEYDIFGLAETNTDWRAVEKDSRLSAKTRGWWETTHISFAHNCTTPPKGKHQWGGTQPFYQLIKEIKCQTKELMSPI